MHRSRSALLLPIWSLLVAATAIFATLGWRVRPLEASAVGGTLALVGLIDLLLARARG